ncbi:hypothetical protein ACH5RR_003532 [Cinchona calisaya]|uniref:Uncharacterized protein n=1 Tax=Cinchona calisaya TaxID=153742 RepID=A0ABD3AVF1_9GENT
MMPLPCVVLFNQLLTGIVKLKHYSSVVTLFKDFCILGTLVDDYSLNIVIKCYCMSRVDLGFCILSGFFKQGVVPDVSTFSTLLKGQFRENYPNHSNIIINSSSCRSVVTRLYWYYILVV